MKIQFTVYLLFDSPACLTLEFRQTQWSIQSMIFSMVKDTDGPTVWSNGPRYKYDPEIDRKTVKCFISLTNLVDIIFLEFRQKSCSLLKGSKSNVLPSRNNFPAVN